MKKVDATRVRKAMSMAMWTEIRQALLQDFPEISIPLKSGPAVKKLVDVYVSDLHEYYKGVNS